MWKLSPWRTYSVKASKEKTSQSYRSTLLCILMTNSRVSILVKNIKYSHVYNTTLKFHLSYLILSSNVIYIQLCNFQHTFSNTIVALDCLLGCVSNFFLIFLLEFYKSEEIHGSLVSKLFISSARCTWVVMVVSVIVLYTVGSLCFIRHLTNLLLLTFWVSCQRK